MDSGGVLAGHEKVLKGLLKLDLKDLKLIVMSSTEIGIEAARKILGDLALQVRRTSEPVILTRGNSRTPIARIAPLEGTMTETPVKIIPRTTAAGLHRHYAGEEHPQPCYIELDIRDGEMLADWDSAVEGGMSRSEWTGLVRRYPIPALSAEAATRVMEELRPYAERIVADSGQVWDGSDHVAQLGEDAHAAEAEIRRMLGDDEDCEPSIYDPHADTVTVWDADGAIYGDEVAEYGITAATTDERLDEICESIRAQLAEVSDTSVAILDDSVRDYLYGLRDELAAGETLYWSLVRGESPGVRAVEPHPLGVEIPDSVMSWAEGYGLSLEEPDVYILVTTEDEAGEVTGEIAYMTTTGTVEDARLIRGQLAAE